MQEDKIKYLEAQVEALQRENLENKNKIKTLRKEVRFYRNLAKYKDFIGL